MTTEFAPPSGPPADRPTIYSPDLLRNIVDTQAEWIMSLHSSILGLVKAINILAARIQVLETQASAVVPPGPDMPGGYL